MYPKVWGWKEPAYTDLCSEAAGNYTDESGAMLGTYGGFFEAGSACPLAPCPPVPPCTAPLCQYIV